MEGISHQDVPHVQDVDDSCHQSEAKSDTTIDFLNQRNIDAFLKESERRHRFLRICEKIYDNILIDSNDLSVVRCIFERYREHNSGEALFGSNTTHDQSERDSLEYVWKHEDEFAAMTSSYSNQTNDDACSLNKRRQKRKLKRIIGGLSSSDSENDSNISKQRKPPNAVTMKNDNPLHENKEPKRPPKRERRTQSIAERVKNDKRRCCIDAKYIMNTLQKDSESTDEELFDDRADKVADDARKQNLMINPIVPVKNDNREMYLTNPKCSPYCVLCGKKPESLASHYINRHPLHENFVSRLSSKMIHSMEKHKIAERSDDNKFSAICIFCEQTKQERKHHWLNHMATHTGELQYKCSSCHYKDNGKRTGCCPNSNCVQVFKIEFVNDCLNGFICSLCNYAQLTEENMIRHLEKNHESNDYFEMTFLNLGRCDSIAVCMPNGNNVNGNNMYLSNTKGKRDPECVLCDESPPSLYTRYARKHPDKENFISRISPEMMRKQQIEKALLSKFNIRPAQVVIERYQPPTPPELVVTQLSANELNVPSIVEMSDSIPLDIHQNGSNDTQNEGNEALSTATEIPLNIVNHDTTPSQVPEIQKQQSAELSKVQPKETENPPQSIRIAQVVSLRRPSMSQSMIQIPTDDVQLKPWTNNTTAKIPIQAKNMLRDEKLFALFKCMGEKCVFSSSDKQRMAEHLVFHEQHTNMINTSESTSKCPAFECAYCCVLSQSSSELVDHIIATHSSSIFQCQYCFYRTVDAYGLTIHLAKYHNGNEPVILVCSGYQSQLRMTELIQRQMDKVLPIVCVEDGYLFYSIDHFVWHISNRHVRESFVCHACRQICRIDMAKCHLNCHSLAEFQCLHCNFSSQKLNRITSHMADAHANQLMFIGARHYRSDYSPLEYSRADSTIILNLSGKIDMSVVHFRKSEANAMDINKILSDHSLQLSLQQFITIDDFQKSYYKQCHDEDYELCEDLWKT